MTLESLLKELYERDQVTIVEQKKAQLERIYLAATDRLRQCAALCGMSEEQVLRACVRAANHYDSLTWNDVLDVFISIHLARKQLAGENDLENSVFAIAELPGLARLIEHDAGMLLNDIEAYDALHHPKNRDEARKRITMLRFALMRVEQKIEEMEQRRDPK